MPIETERAHLQKRYPVEFEHGYRTGFSRERQRPCDAAGYILAHHTWQVSRKNAWFAGWNLGHAESGGCGKSRACAVLAAWIAACFDWRPILGHGERGQLAVLASTRDQAANVFNFVAGALDASQALRNMVIGRTADTISLRSGVDITVRPASFRSTRGTTLIAAVCDEIAWWKDENSALPDVEILRALRPGLMTTKGPLIAISSPFGKRGELWKAFDKHYAKPASRTLVARAPSITMNSGLDPAWIAEQIALDPVGADSEYNATFRNNTDAFLRQEFVEACIVRGRHELQPIAGRRYHAFTDASGDASDSFTLGISHLEDSIAILDCIREVKPPFSHQNVVTEFAAVCKSHYGPATVSGSVARPWQ